MDEFQVSPFDELLGLPGINSLEDIFGDVGIPGLNYSFEDIFGDVGVPGLNTSVEDIFADIAIPSSGASDSSNPFPGGNNAFGSGNNSFAGGNPLGDNPSGGNPSINDIPFINGPVTSS